MTFIGIYLTVCFIVAVFALVLIYIKSRKLKKIRLEEEYEDLERIRYFAP